MESLTPLAQANMIPMETLEGRYVAGMHRRLVQSAAEGGMNMLRVWGGGIYPYQEWFDACDEFGIMVFQVCGARPGGWLAGPRGVHPGV